MELKVFTQSLDVPAYLCDRYDRLHPWAAIRLCQEVSEAHSKATGIGYETLLKQNKIWIISRAYYMIYRRSTAGEKIMLSTWSRGNDGLFAFRDYRMESPAGETLLVGTTYWPIIDFTQRRPIRLKDELNHYPYHLEHATNHSDLQRLRLPDMTDADASLQRIAHFSMIDHAQHVNNSEYVRIIVDSLMQYRFDLEQPFYLELNYNHETQPNDTLSVLHKQTDDATWFQILNSRGVSVLAKVSSV